MSPKAFPSLNLSSTSLSVFLPLLFCLTIPEFVKGSIQISRSFSSIYGSETDRLSLLAIKSQLQDPLETLSSWNSSLNHCMWRGIVCGRRHRRVISLNLYSLGLVGTLSPSIGNLSFLHALLIYNNTFRGQLPPQLGRLSRLRILHAGNNSFTGHIPANLSRCVNLVALYVFQNELAGSLPGELAFLSKLEYLNLLGNRLTGDISVLGNLTYLDCLSVARNAFSGTIPETLGRLKSLTYLGLGANNLSGPVPPSLYNLSSLTYLELAMNMLEGSLHQDIGLMFPRLQVALLYSNSFSGLLPLSLSNLTEIEHLELGNNHFIGKVAISGEKMPKLLSLILANSDLGLREPDDLNFLESLVNCSLLHALELNSNNLGGELPSSVSNFSKTLAFFFVDNNLIGGSLPSGLTNLVNLYGLDVSHNQFTGAIPDDIGLLQLLNSADFSWNQFTGNIPPSFGNLSILSELSLNNNRLEGLIPATLGNCTNLLELHMEKNRLAGTIPAQLFTADAPLFALTLGANRLKGGLPLEVGRLKRLVYLSVPHNELSGDIPASLGSCTSLLELDMESNSFKGSIPDSFSALTSLEGLDLSINNLTGRVPSYLSNFPLLNLNLSFNDFEGEVPTVGVFANTSVVLLEGNRQLCGGVVALHLPKCIQRDVKPRSRRQKMLIMTISMTCVAVIATLMLIMFCMMRKKSKNLARAELTSAHERFLRVSYEMLLKATDGFSPANLIGKGGFGSVYKGILAVPDATEVPIAVKVLDLQRRGSSKSFIAECKALARIRHRNLVRIMSACSSIDFKGNNFKALIYAFISNGSLEQWLYPGRGAGDPTSKFQQFGLLHRVNVAIDMASVLVYLHSGCATAVVHCDVKPSNILLDEDMVAHLADFGLSRLLDDMGDQYRSSSNGVKGTVGYVAPEYGLGTRVTTKGDVYSFGIVLLELMIRRRPADPSFDNGLNLHKLAEMALVDQDHMTDIIDAALIEEDNEATQSEDEIYQATNRKYRADRHVEYCKKMECITSILKVGVACSMESPDDRLSLDEAVRVLKLAKDVLLGARALSVPRFP